MSVLIHWFRLWLTYKVAPTGVLVVDIHAALEENHECAMEIMRAISQLKPKRRYMVQRRFGPFSWYREAR